MDKPASQPKYIKFRMRCGRVIIVLRTPQAYEQARRQGWVEVK